MARRAARLRRALLALLLVGAAIAFVFAASLPAFCPVRVALGVPCPSCGLTRATRLALGGEFAAASRMHPLWFLAAPYIAVLLGIELASYVATGRARAALRLPSMRRAGQVLIALLLLAWIARFFGAFGGPCRVDGI